MTSRRSVVYFLAAGIFGVPLFARAQKSTKTLRIGYLSVDPKPGPQDELFKRNLRELGWVEGQSVLFEHRWAATGVDRLPVMAEELVALKVDLIVVWGTMATLAAKKATASIPIVMVRVADPVGSGIVHSLGRPGGNITGVSSIAPDFVGKHLEMLKEIVPGLTRVAYLAHAGDPAHKLFLKQAQDAGRVLGLRIQAVVADNVEGIDNAFSAMAREQAGGLIVQPIFVSRGEGQRIAQLAMRNRLPAIGGGSAFADVGGLVSYSPDSTVRLRRAAAIVDRVLRGTKPSDLPIEQPTHFELVVNMKTAKTLGVKIPQTILVRAERVIE